MNISETIALISGVSLFESVKVISLDDGTKVALAKNEPRDNLLRFLSNAKYGEVRGLILDNGEVYWWPAASTMHLEIEQFLGEKGYEIYLYTASNIKKFGFKVEPGNEGALAFIASERDDTLIDRIHKCPYLIDLLSDGTILVEIRPDNLTAFNINEL